VPPAVLPLWQVIDTSAACGCPRWRCPARAESSATFHDSLGSTSGSAGSASPG
jgi:hypothetical protein